MVEILILTLIIIGLSIVLLGIRVFFVKGGKFPGLHVSDSPEMRKRGISCHVSQVRELENHKNLYDRVFDEL